MTKLNTATFDDGGTKSFVQPHGQQQLDAEELGISKSSYSKALRAARREQFRRFLKAAVNTDEKVWEFLQWCRFLPRTDIERMNVGVDWFEIEGLTPKEAV